MASLAQKRTLLFFLVLLVILFLVMFAGFGRTEYNVKQWKKLLDRYSPIVIDNNKPEQKSPELAFHWLNKKNYLPNYFTRRPDLESLFNWPHRDVYRNGTIVFVHNQKSGGTTTKDCLRKIINPPPILAANFNAEEFYTHMLEKDENQDLARCYFGDSTFGICDFTDKPCSYFTFLRDPYERSVSSYNMCNILTRQKIARPLCTARNATEMTVNEWAKHQGSFFFRQLLANPIFFTKAFSPKRTPDDPPAEKMPAWWKNELILKNFMSENEKLEVLDYVLDNLEKWFAVIGLTSDYDTSMALIEQVYDIPLKSECAGDVANERPYTLIGQSSQMSKEDIANQMVAELYSDITVHEALRYDIEIYRKAKDIFRRQKIQFEKDRMK